LQALFDWLSKRFQNALGLRNARLCGLSAGRAVRIIQARQTKGADLKLLLVEDDPDMLRALGRALDRRGFSVTSCVDGAQALRLAREGLHDVMLLDLSLPVIDGLHVLQRLRAEGNAGLVLVLTARGSVGDRIAGLNAGADDYLPKPFDLDELVARIHAMWRRRKSEQAPVLRCGTLSYDSVAGAPYVNDSPLELTPRENALLRALIKTPGQAVGREQVCRLVFASDEAAHGDAIDVVVHRLRKKLAPSGTEVLTLRGVGYLLREKPVGP
jgi:DNA-binding response OmpR family regulator